jgi:hypothetical protein
MANEKEPTAAGYVGHYTAVLSTACQSRSMVMGNTKVDRESRANIDAAIKAICGAIISNVEKAKTNGAQ